MPADPVPDGTPSTLRVVPRRHIGRWIGALAVLAFLVWLVVSFAQAQLDWSVVAQYFTARELLHGLAIAILLTVIAMVIGLALGVLTAVMRLSKTP